MEENVALSIYLIRRQIGILARDSRKRIAEAVKRRWAAQKKAAAAK
jgi:hypothetical protein